ncbi:UNKNOWN [Stylonychia lemnae]|uniref:Uncharacterized protein n=1 Tax=Stylonychia lemnae TaxID=5949 RepID=A0A078AEY6_STYLE|nr:UNKNOWN [Stylonychia lemnae]|eukprot:CDW79463.1 UNKNOWN [Stylonychia lemnae]
MTFFYDLGGEKLLEVGSLNNPNVDLQKFVAFALIGKANEERVSNFNDCPFEFSLFHNRNWTQSVGFTKFSFGSDILVII